ncbi:MAG: hypothetical protein IKC01_04175, partial [Clostridia bacterium]|nr:hypothetical protein [Clostridia bacterium]
MSRKNSGLTDILSILLSVSVIVLTVVFSDTLTNLIGKASFYVLSTATGGSDFSSSTPEAEESKKEVSTVDSISGFGSGGTDSFKRADTATPDDIKRIMKEAVSVYKNFKKTGETDETKLAA